MPFSFDVSVAAYHTLIEEKMVQPHRAAYPPSVALPITIIASRYHDGERLFQLMREDIPFLKRITELHFMHRQRIYTD
jgi:hypothetical protein